MKLDAKKIPIKLNILKDLKVKYLGIKD